MPTRTAAVSQFPHIHFHDGDSQWLAVAGYVDLLGEQHVMFAEITQRFMRAVQLDPDGLGLRLHFADGRRSYRPLQLLDQIGLSHLFGFGETQTLNVALRLAVFIHRQQIAHVGGGDPTEPGQDFVLAHDAVFIFGV